MTLHSGNVDCLVYLSKKYLVDGLHCACVAHLSAHLSEHTALSTLLLALVFDAPTLVQQCLASDKLVKWILLKSREVLLLPEESVSVILAESEKQGVSAGVRNKARSRWSDGLRKDKLRKEMHGFKALMSLSFGVLPKVHTEP